MVEIKEFISFTDDILDDIHTLEKTIFEKPLGHDYILDDAKNRHNIFGMIAYDGKKPVAYKIGYEASPKVFYSWLGGVLPDYRGQGLATKLMKRQHEFAKKGNYKRVRTHTFNKFRGMLILNLKTGFDIVGAKHSNEGWGLKLILERDIKTEE